MIPSTVTVPTLLWWIMQGVIDARANAFDRDEAAIQARSVAKAAGMIRTTYWKRNVLYLDSSVVDMAKLLVPMKALLMLLPSACKGYPLQESIPNAAKSSVHDVLQSERLGTLCTH